MVADDRTDPQDSGPSDRFEQIRRVIQTERAADAAGAAALSWRAGMLNPRQTSGRQATLDDALRDALTAVRALLDSDTASLLVADDAGESLVARASIGLSQSVSPGVAIPAGAGVAGRVFATATPVV
ncbi:MAG TPA: hypothetical protein VGP46_08775, partial [Acidimicrobiales bacterium]|nr:hypothetical protein [Acidimicrobiales bacterium]